MWRTTQQTEEVAVVIVLMCPDCYSTKISKYDGKMAELGHDWFHCKVCNKNFTLKKASYREEYDMYE